MFQISGHRLKLVTLALILPFSWVETCYSQESAPKTSDSAAKVNESPVPRKIDIGGRKLTLLTLGSGEPTVVIEAGFGLAAADSDEWKAVCDDIAKTNRVCLYNRAGLGSSDPAPTRPRTSRDVASDLHTLLKNADVPGPYVLVGHSAGGMHVLVYAALYPEDVAAVVLVDAAHPDQDERWLATLPKKTDSEDPAITEARKFLESRLMNRGDNPESLDRVASRRQVLEVKTLGSKPLVVLTHSPDWKMVPNLPDEILAPIERETQRLQAGFAALSTNSSHKIAKKAGHAIHVDDPKLVSAGIREAAAKASAK